MIFQWTIENCPLSFQPSEQNTPNYLQYSIERANITSSSLLCFSTDADTIKKERTQSLVLRRHEIIYGFRDVSLSGTR